MPLLHPQPDRSRGSRTPLREAPTSGSLRFDHRRFARQVSRHHPRTNPTAWAVSLGLVPSYGLRGTIPALRSQLHQLLSTTVSITWDTTRRSPGSTPECIGSAGFRIGYEHNLDSAANALHVRLSTDFYEQLRDRPVPLDMNVLKSLRSPFQMDIYAWLSLRSLRTLRLNRPEAVPWQVLREMFGSDYAEIRQFRFAFLHALQKVAKVYPALRVESHDNALFLLPYPPSVRPRRL